MSFGRGISINHLEAEREILIADPSPAIQRSDPLHFQFRRRYTLMKLCELDRGYLGQEISCLSPWIRGLCGLRVDSSINKSPLPLARARALPPLKRSSKPAHCTRGFTLFAPKAIRLWYAPLHIQFPTNSTSQCALQRAMDATRNGPEWNSQAEEPTANGWRCRRAGRMQESQIRKVIQLKLGEICANLETCKVLEPK